MSAKTRFRVGRPARASTWDDAYDVQQERMQEDWMAEKRGERRCEICDGNGLARDMDPCFSCRGTGFVAVSGG